GHGRPLRGPGLRRALHDLARDFASVAVPARGRYVEAPVRAGDPAATRAP
ncbi:MBL fold metallo-hydrolase, partial [Methylobacterium sp. IIF4SW-B5]|nr:MBL fold metallo-hydrolase [Methylobacterium ajmalii]